jgi:hypothetical protein
MSQYGGPAMAAVSDVDHISPEYDLRTGREACCKRNGDKPRFIPLSAATAVQIHALGCAFSLLSSAEALLSLEPAHKHHSNRIERPSGAKSPIFIGHFAARLKSCPDTKLPQFMAMAVFWQARKPCPFEGES